MWNLCPLDPPKRSIYSCFVKLLKDYICYILLKVFPFSGRGWSLYFNEWFSQSFKGWKLRKSKICCLSCCQIEEKPRKFVKQPLCVLLASTWGGNDWDIILRCLASSKWDYVVLWLPTSHSRLFRTFPKTNNFDTIMKVCEGKFKWRFNRKILAPILAIGVIFVPTK